MLLITTISMVIVAAIGLLGETVMNTAAMAGYREGQAHERQMRRAAERGWQVFDSAATHRLTTHGSIVVLHASEHFEVPLADAPLSGAGITRVAADAFLATITSEFERY